MTRRRRSARTYQAVVESALSEAPIARDLSDLICFSQSPRPQLCDASTAGIEMSALNNTVPLCPPFSPRPPRNWYRRWGGGKSRLRVRRRDALRRREPPLDRPGHPADCRPLLPGLFADVEPEEASAPPGFPVVRIQHPNGDACAATLVARAVSDSAASTSSGITRAPAVAPSRIPGRDLGAPLAHHAIRRVYRHERLAHSTPGMGRIVNISSVHGLAIAYNPRYVTASRPRRVTKAVALDAAEKEAVNAVRPSYVRTPLTVEKLSPTRRRSRDQEDAVTAKSCSRRRAQEARTVVVAASSVPVLDDASGITGATQVIDRDGRRASVRWPSRFRRLKPVAHLDSARSASRRRISRAISCCLAVVATIGVSQHVVTRTRPSGGRLGRVATSWGWEKRPEETDSDVKRSVVSNEGSRPNG